MTMSAARPQYLWTHAMTATGTRLCWWIQELVDDPDLAFVKTYSDQPGLIEFGFKVKLARRSGNLRMVGLGYEG